MIIEDLNLSVRAYNCLKMAGIRTIDEISLIDLKKLKNCGKKTREEIETKLAEIKKQGYSYKEYINMLPLSKESRKILSVLSIKCGKDLLLIDENILSLVPTANKKHIREIMAYIGENKDILLNDNTLKEKREYALSLTQYINFSGQVELSRIPISEQLLKELNDNNIFNIIDLLANKIEVSKLCNLEYESMYDYFHNLAYKRLNIDFYDNLNRCTIKLPFELKDYKEKEYIRIPDLIKYIMNNFMSFKKEEKINTKLYLHWLNTYKGKNVEEIFFDRLKMTENQIEIIGKRLYTTLEEIGNNFGVTRERIRQIEKNGNIKIQRVIKRFPFKLIDLKSIYDVSKLSTRELFLLYIETKIENNFFSREYNNDQLFVPSYHYIKIKDLIDLKSDELESNGFLEYDDESYPIILKHTIEFMDLNMHNKKISKKYNKRQLVKYAMKYLNRNINISTQRDLDDVEKAVYALFGIKLECSARALVALICEAGVRVDSGTYSAEDEIINLDYKTLNEIVAYVKEKEIINTRDLFVKFGKVLLEHKLNNESILYRYLKEKLSNRLYFHGVSAVISSNKDLTCWADVVIRDIKETNKPMNKLDFMVKYSITEPVYQMLTVNFQDIIPWSSKELYLKSKLVINENLKKDFVEFLNNKQIVTFEEVKEYLIKNDKDILLTNNIKTNINLYHFLKNILSDDYIVDNEKEEVRIKRKFNKTAEEKYESVKELTL